jgi:enamine deaminase RidA (YjgF/YER057c/UK114 family)
VVKTTILLVDMAHFPVVNDVYKGFFNEAQGYPARACYQVDSRFLFSNNINILNFI